MPTSPAANRARALDDLLEAARAELAAVGAPALSLRSVARRLDVVPSALYRYVDGRDALLTMLIVDAYRRLGAVVEEAGGPRPGATPADRWLAVGRAARAWAWAQPADWALLYGSPVTGYQAPADTIEPGTTLVRVLASIIAAAHPDAAHPGGTDPGLPVDLPIPDDLHRWVGIVAPAGGLDASDRLVALAVTALVQVLGGISLELFGQYGPDATPAAAVYDHGLRVSAALLGLGPESR